MLKRVVVTGGGGYVGACLIPKLLEKGYHVIAYDLFLYGKQCMPTHPNLELVEADIRNQEMLETAFTGADAIIR